MKKHLLNPTEFSDPEGLRRVISTGKSGDDLWPDRSDQRKVENAGLNYINPVEYTERRFEFADIQPSNADAGLHYYGPKITVDTFTVENIPNGLTQPWDVQPTTDGTTVRPEKGPAVRSLERKRSRNA